MLAKDVVRFLARYVGADREVETRDPVSRSQAGLGAAPRKRQARRKGGIHVGSVT